MPAGRPSSISELRLPEVAALGVVLALALALRVQGLGFGLPAVYNPDEIAIMARALGFAKGDFDPHNFLYPTFYFYVLFAWVGAAFAVARVTGAVPSLSAFQTEFFVDPTRVYLAGRWLGVACGVASVAATWWLARRLFGRAAGLAAALFLAVAPVAVRDAHYVKHDVPVSLLVVLATLAMVRLAPTLADNRWRRGEPEALRRATLRDAASAGAACGAAFSTHYYAVFLALPLAWACWCRTRGQGLGGALRTMLVAGAASAAVFFLLSPYLLPEWRTAVRDVVANRQIVMDRAADLGGARLLPSAGTYARILWQEGTGWPVILLGVAGFVAILRTRWRTAVLLGLFPAAFLLFLGNTVAASRYLNPVLPFVAVLAASVVGGLARGAGGGGERWLAGTPAGPPSGRTDGPKAASLATGRRGAVAAVLAVAAALPGAVHANRIGQFFGETDTRTLAQHFVETHAAPGSTVLLQPYSVQLHQSREGLVEALTRNVGGPERASTKFALRLALTPYPSPAYRTLWIGDGGLDADKIYVPYAEVRGADPLRALRALGVQLVVWKRYDPPGAEAADLLAALGREATRLAVFSPYTDGAPSTAGRPEPFLHNTDTPVDPSLERPGPVVEVWKVR